MNKQLRMAGIFGIIALITILPLSLVAFLRGLDTIVFSTTFFVFYLVALLIYTLFYILFMYGFVQVGKKLNNSLLVVTSYLSIALSIAAVFVEIVSSLTPKFSALVLSSIYVFVSGAITLPYGISFLKLKQKFGGVATAAGVLNIISGVSFITILLSPVGILLILPTAILEIMIMFRAARELK